MKLGATMEDEKLCAQCRNETPQAAKTCASCGSNDFVWLCPCCGDPVRYLKTWRIAMVSIVGAAMALPLAIWHFSGTDRSQIILATGLGAFAGMFLGNVDWHTLRHMVLPLSLHDGRIRFDGKGFSRAWGIREPLSQGAWASAVCTAAVVVGFGDWPYGYYILLRLLLCGVSLFLLSGDKSRLQDWHWWTLAGLAVLYNPLLPVELGDKDLWGVVNVATIVVFWTVSLRGVRPRLRP